MHCMGSRYDLHFFLCTCTSCILAVDCNGCACDCLMKSASFCYLCSSGVVSSELRAALT
jgi:hypothetical protein